MSIYLSQADHLIALEYDIALTKMFFKYSNYTDIFSSDLAIEILKNTSIYEYVI